jgi:hypothetical protein
MKSYYKYVKKYEFILFKFIFFNCMNSYFILSYDIVPSFLHINLYPNHLPMNSYVITRTGDICLATSCAMNDNINHRVHSPSVAVDYEELPNGWEKRFDPCRRAFYIDHNTKTATWLWPPFTTFEDQTNNRIVASVKNLLHLTSDMNSWSSKFVVTHGNTTIDVFSATLGLPSSPSDIFPPQNISYPSTTYYFDDNLFFWYWC